MPDSVSMNVASSAGSSLFASNNASSAPAGLFDLLTALFGAQPTGDMLNQLSQLTGGKNLPTLDAAQLQKLQDMLATPASSTLPDMSTLLAQLQQSGDGNGALAQFLTKVNASLAGDDLDAEALKAEFAKLDDDDKTALLADVQTLLLPAPVLPPPGDKLKPVATLPTDTNEATPLDEAAPAAPPLPPQDLAADAAAQAAKDKAAAAAAQLASANPAPVQAPPAAAEPTTEKPRAKTMGMQFAPDKQPISLTPETESKARPEPSLALHEIAKALKEAAGETDTTLTDEMKQKVAQVSIPEAPAAKEAAPAVVAAPAPVAAKVDVVAAPEVTADAAKAAPVAAMAGETNPLLKAATNGAALKTEPVNAEASNTTPTPQVSPGNTPHTSSFANEIKAIQQTHGTPHTPMSQQIGVQLRKGVTDGQDRITIRLQPPELGRIDVKLEVDSTGRVTAVVSADNPVTLDLMKRDQSGLERALTDAGLKTDSGSLNFQSRQEGQAFAGQQGGNDRQSQNNNGQPGRWNGTDEENATPSMEMTWFATSDRVDVRI